MAINDYGVSFNGRRIVHPGAYDYIDASAMIVPAQGSLNIPIVIGESDSGKSGEVKWFTDYQMAKSYLKGGSLLTSIGLMFAPIPEGGGGCSIVGTIIANPTTQAALTSGNVTVTSREYGEGGNRIQTKVEAGTVSGTKKLTAYRWDTDQTEVFNNLGAVIELTYTGSAAYAVVDVTQTESLAVTLTTKTGTNVGDAVTDISIDLTKSQFATMGDIVSYINSISDYTATLVNTQATSLASSSLDVATAVSIKTAAYVKALSGDFVYQINTYSELVTVAVTGAISNFAYTYLISGAKGTTPSSWTSLLSLTADEFSDILVILSSSSAIQAEASAHVADMELRNQRQILFTGGATGETIDQIKARAAALNTSRAVVAYPGIVKNGITLPSYYTAALLAGRVAGVGISEPITFDYFGVEGLEVNLVAGDPDIDDLITSGVATLEKVQNGGTRLAHSVTTYLGPNNILYRELSVRRTADAVSQRIRKTLEDTFVGKKGSNATITSVATKTASVLDQIITEGDILDYKNISVRFANTAVYVSYQVSAVDPINYILITSHFVPQV